MSPLVKLRRSRYAVADRLDEVGLAVVVRRALGGGGEATSLQDPALVQSAVIWHDMGDEVLVHLDSVQVKVLPRYVFVSVDLECEQTGRAALIVTLAMGSTQDGAGLYATTDELPRGHPVLAARWGPPLRQTVWSALLGLAAQHADERRQVPLSMHALEGALRFGAAPAISLQEHARDSFDAAFPGRRDAMRKARK